MLSSFETVLPENSAAHAPRTGDERKGEPKVSDHALDMTPCFTLGTVIATQLGEIPVEDLNVGDRVLTRDHGMQTIREIARRDVSAAEGAATPKLAPVRVRAGALSGGFPVRDLVLSPNHRVLISGCKTASQFGEAEVLVAARDLVGMKGVVQDEPRAVSYFHLLFDGDEVILSNGAWAENWRPVHSNHLGLMSEAKADLGGLFPELSAVDADGSRSSGRKVLKRHEAWLLAA